MSWNPQSAAADDIFGAFPGHNRATSNGSPWSPAGNLPPSWIPPPNTAIPPAWATNAPQSPTLGWNAPSPFRNPMEVNRNESHWGDTGGWGRPADSASGQPMTPGFFGANASPNHNPWNTLIRSTSERTAPAWGNPSPAPWATPSSPTPGWEISRPRSAFGGGRYPPSPSVRFSVPAHLIPDTWDETNLARRPRDWRASYNPRASFLSSLASLPSAIKNQSDVQEYTDPTKRRVTPSLAYNTHEPPLYHDLRLDPFNPSHPVLHSQSSTLTHTQPFSELDFAQFATTPPAKFLRLFHPKLPWYIDIEQSHPNGITVGDILMQVYNALGQQILPRHYWNDALSERERKDIGKAYKRRVDLLKRERIGEAERGILWIDFLCGEVLFEGLVRHKGGMLEIKTRNAYQ